MEHPGEPLATPKTYTRRSALAMGGAAVAAVSLTDHAPAAAATPAPVPDPALVDALRPEIAPRQAWAGELPVVGEILPEDDVRFLLVHHTASRNEYQPEEVAGEIRDFYGFHTGPEKGWPDVAYNFFVDRFGGIWEARAGSIDGPVRGDATGGSQGFAMLCSLIGDHSQVEVSAEALTSLTLLLAWLAERHGIDTTPGATIDFISRGSNRWPVGTEVTATTISGHRDMSQTSCPGDFAYGLLPDTVPTLVSAHRARATAELAATSTTAPVNTATTDSTPDTSAPISTTMVTEPEPESEPDPEGVAAGDPDGDSGGAGGPAVGTVLLGVGATAIAVLVAGAVRLRGRTEG